MIRFPLLAVIALAAASSGCGTPASPAAPSRALAPSLAAAPPAAAASIEVRLIDAIAGAPSAGVSVAIESRPMATSDPDGCATLVVSGVGRYAVSLRGPGVVTRTTSVRIPSPELRLSLIPGTFALAAFDQMFRGRTAELERWNTAPRLVIVGREVAYDAGYSNDLKVLTGMLGDSERDQLAADLSDGFGVLTDRRLGEFASVATEWPAAGSTASILRTGAIVVARSRGLSAATGVWGLGQWATLADGEVVAGYLLLDADFDGPASSYPQFRRSLRIHELGHALGYGHVTLVQSVMNPAARLEPTPWDLQAVHIAFQRPPGSTSPDNDPEPRDAARSRALSLSPRMQ